MKNYFKYLAPAIVLIGALLVGQIENAFAATPVTQIVNGGTASSTPLGGILFGNGLSPIRSLTVGSGLTLTGTTLSATGGSSASSTLLGDSNTFSGTINKFTNAPAVGVSGLLKGNGSSAITAGVNGTDFTLLTAKTCNAGDFVSAATAAGVFTCTTPAGTSYTGTYPIIVTGSVISSGFGTTTTWGMGNNGIVMTGATGIPYVTATSSPISLNISGNAATVTTNANLTGVVTSSGNATSFAASPTFSGTVTGTTFAGAGTSLTGTAASLSIGGLAGTATALAANGTNCSAGNAPLGVDASGNSEGCFAVSTFGYPFTPLAFGSITTSATSSALYPAGGLVTGTSTIGTLVASSSITNQAVKSALVLNGAGGLEGAYAGSNPCSATQAALSISATGVITCTDVSTFSYPFTPSTFGINVSATSTALYPSGLITGTSTIGALVASSSITNQSVKSALVLNSAAGLEGAYAGSNPCTNQVALSISAVGVISCTSIANAMITNSTIDLTAKVTGVLPIANGGSNQSSFGTTNGLVAFDGTRLNNFSGYTLTSSLLTLVNASTTNLTASSELVIPNGSSKGSTVAGQTELDTTNDQLKIGDGSATAIFDPRTSFTFGISTSTAWTGTTTAPTITIPTGLIWTQISCLVQPAGSTVEVGYQYNNTASAPVFTYLAASSTNGVVAMSSNNTPSTNATSTISFGNPTGSPTSAACTLTGTVTGT